VEAHTTNAARPAVPDDAAEVIRLARVMFDALGIEGRNAMWREQADARLRAGLQDGTVAAFVVDAPGAPGALVSSAAVSITQRLPTPMGDGRTAYVQWVATDAAWRRRGFGRQVMTALIDWVRASGVGIVDLHASPDGIPLYRDLGFRESDHPELRLAINR
jgi:ribosomal protein S18 acetylase RimI-like enzyme